MFTNGSRRNFYQLFFYGWRPKCDSFHLIFKWHNQNYRFLNYCSSTVVSISPHQHSPSLLPASHPQSYPSLALSMGPLFMFLDLSLPLISSAIPSPLKNIILICSLCFFCHFSSHLALILFLHQCPEFLAVLCSEINAARGSIQLPSSVMCDIRGGIWTFSWPIWKNFSWAFLSTWLLRTKLFW